MHTQNLAPQRFMLLIMCLLMSHTLAHAAPSRATVQTTDAADRARALQMWEENNYVGALPLLEKLAKADPTDIAVLSRLGFALYATSASVRDAAARQGMRDRALRLLLQSQKTGDGQAT